MEKPLGLAIIGCGWAGTRHAHAFDQRGAEIRWCADLDLGRARALAASMAQFGHPARATADRQEAVGDPEVDAMVICLPHNLHAAVSVEAAEAGKHVLCEKPIAHSLAAADRMIAVADRAGVILMVAENMRFDPLYRRVRELLDDGVVGRPALLQMTRESNLEQIFLEDRRWFLDSEAAAGGIMMSGGVHDFEKMRMLLGEVESVYALRARQRFLEMEGDDTSIALVKFCDGTVGTLVESFSMKSLETASGAERHTLRIDGDLGSLAARAPHTIRIYSERPALAVGGAPAAHEIHVPGQDTFVLEAAHFQHCIRTGAEPLTSGRSQRRPLELVLAAYRSMETGLPVQISQ